MLIAASCAKSSIVASAYLPVDCAMPRLSYRKYGDSFSGQQIGENQKRFVAGDGFVAIGRGRTTNQHGCRKWPRTLRQRESPRECCVSRRR